MNYNQFLESKIKIAVRHGINVNPEDLHPSLLYRPENNQMIGRKKEKATGKYYYRCTDCCEYYHYESFHKCKKQGKK